MKFGLILLLTFYFCKPADPNYRSKPLQNTEYTGFISRTFFQAVVEVPLTKEELTILDERKSCMKEAMKKRDRIVVPILKKVAMEDKWNERERNLEKERADDKDKAKQKEDEYLKSLPDAKSALPEDASIYDKKTVEAKKAKSPMVNRGEFAWFLDSMFIYKEDYSDPEKCSFVFRNIQDKLFERVEKTKLSFIGEDKASPFKPAATPTNPANATGLPTSPGTATPTTTGLPQTIR